MIRRYASTWMHDTYFKLIRGEKRGPLASTARVLLRLAAVGYWCAVRIRNWLFDSGFSSVRRLPVPVISIGNITTGGTGKTPCVALFCRLLLAHGTFPGIISRGYGASQGLPNDEKRVLNHLLPDVPHEQDPDRFAAGTRLLQNAPRCTVIVMDDGFQHRRLHRDLNVVLVDVTNPFGYGALLPAGLLREPLSGLARADLIILTRCEQVSEQCLVSVTERIAVFARQSPERILRLTFETTGLLTAAGETHKLSDLEDRSAYLVSAIGNPAAFQNTCEKTGFSVLQSTFFPDHHTFTSSELAALEAAARKLGAARILMTLKDLVKVPKGNSFFQALMIDAHWPDPRHETVLVEELQRAISAIQPVAD